MTKPAFKVFLSHRYKSPEINQHFFDVLSSHGNLLFEVDVGVKATNVTRLEKAIRDADAFVGIYPFPSEDDAHPDLDTALHASRYFRLELDLALRSRRPAIVFVDDRYGTAITVPQTIREFRYDHQEVPGVTSSKRNAQLERLAREFCKDVAAVMLSEQDRGGSSARDIVGIILPSGSSRTSGYSRQQIAKIEERLTQQALRTVHLDPKSVVDGPFMRELEDLDWAVVDIGTAACAGGLPGFIHGRFIPQMRLLHTDAKRTHSPLETTLLAAFDVGYPKDIIRWSNGETLDRELVQRLTTLYEPRKYIRTQVEAREYFASAALRKEAVFLSYSGADREFVADLAKALRSKFQQVFDYRDQGESIVPGRRWISEVFDKLSASAIGIPILSPTYFESGNCTHEARQMVALADAGKLRMFPVKINKGELELPSWMQDLQYARGWEYSGPEELADKIIAWYDS